MVQGKHTEHLHVWLPLILALLLMAVAGAVGIAITAATPAALHDGVGQVLWWSLASVAGMALIAGAAVVLARWSARRALAPWLALAQAMQVRTASDLTPVSVPACAPPELRTMADSLNQLFARIHAESDAQQRFIADAAHQLRTPLAALQSQVEAWALMVKSSPSQSIVLVREQVEHLRHASRRTTQLANQLLALSRVDSGLGLDKAAQRVDIKSLCEALFESFLDAALAKKLDLGLEADAAHVSGQEWLLREMIGNILDNAIKYTPDGGQITLRCGRCDIGKGLSRVYIEVEDDGPGVPVGEYARLTQRFYRLAGTVADGSGLGLAIVQEIAQAHGAHLSFKAGSAGRGLCVMLLFKE